MTAKKNEHEDSSRPESWEWYSLPLLLRLWRWLQVVAGRIAARLLLNFTARLALVRAVFLLYAHCILRVCGQGGCRHGEYH